MDTWFPIFVLFCGVFLQAALQLPDAKKNIDLHHPVPGSFHRMDKASWLFITVGSLWSIQLLLV